MIRATESSLLQALNRCKLTLERQELLKRLYILQKQHRLQAAQTAEKAGADRSEPH